MGNSETYFDDEIDLREVVSTLWRGRWIIIALTLIAAVAAFAISKWGMTKKYQATALVAIEKPVVQFEDINDILYNSSIPDAEYVQEVAASESFLENVTTSSNIAPHWDVETDSIIGMVEVVIIGEHQLRLNVRDADPERAMLLTNIWAEQIVQKINGLYGVEAIANTLDAQVAQAYADSTHAQAVFEKALIQSKQSILEAQIKSAKNDLNCILQRISASTRILEDVQVLEKSISGLPGEAFLSLGDLLALTTLQQRASASQICASGTQNSLLQFNDDNLLVGISVSVALDITSKMREALQAQQPTLDDEQLRLEGIIPSMESSLANEQSQLGKYLNIRDQTLEIYTTLLEQQTRIKNILITNAKVATVSVHAIAPDYPIGSKTLMYTALAGALGLMLGVFWVFVVGWWRSSENTVDLDVSERE